MVFRTRRTVKATLIAILAFLVMVVNGTLSTSAFNINEVSTVAQIHDRAVDLNLVKIVNGQIDVDVIANSKAKLNVDETPYQEYIKSIESANKLVRDGYMKINENYDPEIVSEETIKKLSKNEMSSNIVILADRMSLIALVEGNRQELEDYYWNVYWASVLIGNPAISALTASAVWFKGKVETGGPWDYKSVPGWGGYNNLWTAETYSGERSITTEYIGNYNYGYTGEFLFTLQILWYGGQYAGGNIWEQEGQEDRDAIEDGYDDAVDNW